MAVDLGINLGLDAIPTYAGKDHELFGELVRLYNAIRKVSYYVGGAGLLEAIDDRVASTLVAGTNMTITYDDAANTITLDASGGGGGGSIEDILAVSATL